MIMNFNIYKILAISIIALSSCENKSVPDDISRIIDNSSNIQELHNVINYFRNDSLKLQATYFLIRNINNKGTIKYIERNGKGDNVEYNWGKFKNFSEAKDQSVIDGIHLTKEYSYPDVDSIKADFLIKNIENAFETWKYPWATNISFNDFCNYILPFKDRYEPITDNWRQIVKNRNEWIFENEGFEDNLKLANSVNNKLKEIFRFKDTYVLAPPFPTLNKIYGLKMGPCPYMTSLTIYTFRGLGIPVTRDFTPYWTNVQHYSNHEWNAMLGYDGKWYGFMGTEVYYDSIQNYSPSFQSAKVFRETYEIQNIALHDILGGTENVPNKFKRRDIVDVTDQYYPSGNIELKLNDEITNEKAVYLAVYNMKQWKVVYWGEVSNGVARFKNMAKGVLYLPMKYFKNSGFKPIDNPFIYDSNGEITNVIPKEETETICIYSYGLGKLDSKDYINKIIKGQKYSLYCWETNEWRKIATEVAETDTLKFKDVKKGTLLSLGKQGGNSGEQLFIVKNKRLQEFW